MEWWNDLIDWTSSDAGWRLISGALIPFVAIVVAGIVAALIGRGATKRVVSLHEREARNAAVAAVISAARKAASWGSLGHEERAYADHLAEDADVRLRLLPVQGSSLAANWAQHEIADIKKNSSTFSFQAEQSLSEFRDRLLEWQARPNRARKLFKYDLERWKFESPDADADLVQRQQDWNADKASAARAVADESAPATTTTTSIRPTAPASATRTTTATPGTPSSNATTPLGAEQTRPYGDLAPSERATTPITDAGPIRPTLGTPASPASSRATSTSTQTAQTGPSTAASPAGGTSATTSTSARDRDDTDVVDPSDRATAPTSGTMAASGTGAARSETSTPPASTDRPVPPPVARPTAANAHVNRPSANVSSPSTKSIPTRLADAPAEPTDSDETDEAPYTQPISASELRRRAADDED